MSENAPGTIPQSDALAEATTDSLTELLSRDPFEMTRQDRNLIVAALRAQRKKWEAAEAEGAKPKSKKVAEAAKSLIAKVNAEDLGL